MILRRLSSALFASAAMLVAGSAAHAALPRFPQPYGDRIVFVADGNVWSVPKAGGTAERLTSAPGQDMFPRVSPDGRWIAYTEATRAGTDIWVIPATGGQARRLTFEPTTEFGTGGRHGPDSMVVTWTPDSKSVVYMTKKNQWNDWIQQLYAVPVAGGPSVPLPIDSQVGLATYAPDGHAIAYNRIFRNFRTWKRYNGGLAQQVYTFDFATRALKQITDWSGTNTSPMWYGRRIYFLSDRDAAGAPTSGSTTRTPGRPARSPTSPTTTSTSPRWVPTPSPSSRAASCIASTCRARRSRRSRSRSPMTTPACAPTSRT